MSVHTVNKTSELRQCLLTHPSGHKVLGTRFLNWQSFGYQKFDAMSSYLMSAKFPEYAVVMVDTTKAYC